MAKIDVIETSRPGARGDDGLISEAQAKAAVFGDSEWTLTTAAVAANEVTATRLDSRVFDVLAEGAAGDGSTDDTTDIATTQALAASVATANVRTTLALAAGKIHKVSRRVTGSQGDGGILLERGVDLDGHGATLLLNGNCSFVTNRWPQTTANNSTMTGAVTATITANVAVGATTYTVTSTTGLVAGDNVFVRLNDNDWDAVECKDTLYAKVLTVGSGTSITLDRPSPVAMTVASTDAGNRVIQKLHEPWDGGAIRRLTLVNPMTGSANAEAGIELRHARSFTIEDIIADDPGAGAVMLAYCEDGIVRNLRVRTSDKQGGQASKGRVVNLWNAKNLLLENIFGERFEGAFAMVESYCRNVVFDGVHIVNNHPDRDNATDALFVINQGSDASLRNVIVEGKGGFPFIDQSATTGGTIDIQNLWLNTDTPIKGGLDLRFVSGILRIGEAVYSNPIRRTIPFRLPASSTVNVDLPEGIYRQMNVYVSSATGVSGNMYVVTDGGGTNVPTLTSGQVVSIPNYSQYGTDYPANVPGNRHADIYTDGTVPAGSYGFFDIEYWPSALNDGSKGRPEWQLANPPTYAVTNLTTDRTFDADSTSTAELADVLGTLIADLKQSGWIA